MIFLDGFAGPGVYSNGEPGSPLIALTTLVDHAHFQKLSQTEFVFIFVEPEAERFESLRSEVEAFWERREGGQPSNVRVDLVNDEFANVADQIVTSLRDRNQQLAPTLAFVDPFGWSGVPMASIRDLLSSAKCEVLFNFMYDSVNRFVADTRPGIARHFSDLFGTTQDEHQAAAELSCQARKEFLRDLYAGQLRSEAGFNFVRSFELMDVDRGRTAYFLMFGTRHPKGLEVMKSAMWSLDPVSGARFTGFAGDQQMLFEEEPNVEPLRQALLEQFGGQSVTVDEIERFVIEETDYKTTHYKKRVLKPLEDEGVIACLSQRKRKGTYPAGTVLRFPAS